MSDINKRLDAAEQAVFPAKEGKAVYDLYVIRGPDSTPHTKEFFVMTMRQELPDKILRTWRRRDELAGSGQPQDIASLSD